MIPKYLPIFNNRTVKHIILTSGRAGTKSSYAAIRTDYQIVSDPHGSAVVLRKHHALDGSPMNFPINGAWDKSKALMVSGDFSQLVYSIRQDITFKLFTEGVVQNTDGTIAYNLMQNDMVALRAVIRMGWEVPNPINALAKDKTKRCPFSILKAGE